MKRSAFRESINPNFKKVSKSILTDNAINDMFIAEMGDGKTLFFYVDDVERYDRRKVIHVYHCLELAEDNSGWVQYTEQELHLDDGRVRPDPMPSFYASEIKNMYQPKNTELQGVDVTALWINPELKFEVIHCHEDRTGDKVIHDKNCDVALHEALTAVYTTASSNSLPKNQSEYAKAISTISNFIRQKEHNALVIDALDSLQNAAVRPARQANDTAHVLRQRALETLRAFVRSHGGRIP